MEPFYQDPSVTIYNGDALAVLKTLPDESVQMCQTSPPYWGLRNYAGGSDLIWGGDESCKHEWIEVTQGLQHENRNNLIGTQEEVVGKTGTAFIQKYDRLPAGFCCLCGSWKGQLGLEPTPELYVEHLMMIFREVKRVLRKDGSFYLNIGDTYSSKPVGSFTGGGKEFIGRDMSGIKTSGSLDKTLSGIPAKCMVCIPERLMFAMIDAGWILRNKNIWHKGNAMPSSVKDRYTTTYEMLYFFVKARERKGWQNVRVYEMTEPEKAWLAAMIDGEGCIQIAKQSRSEGFQLSIEVANKKKIIAERCRAITGLGSITTFKKGMTNYHIGGRMAEAMLKAIYPYLILKNEQAKVGIYLQSLNSFRGAPKGQQGGNTPLTESQLEERYRLQKLCQGLNQGKVEKSGLPEPNSTLPQKYIGCEKYYFDLDAVRVPHTTESLERYQRGVNLGQPAIGKSAEVGPMQQYKRAPQWFQEQFPPDKDYKGKFDDLFGRGPNLQTFNLRVRDVKRGKGGISAQGGELKASEKEVEEYEYPEKHHGSSMSNEASLHHDRQKHESADLGAQSPARKRHSGYFGDDGQPLVDFTKGKNPGDYWDITTQPSSICVCPKCEAVFPRYTKVCPSCNIEGVVGHFAPYPVSLCERPIKASTRVGDVVLDPLAGGGNTGVAAKKLGRKCILIDCVKEYCIMARYKLSKIEYQPGLEISY